MMSFFVCLSFCRLSFVVGYVVIITTLVFSSFGKNQHLRADPSP
jgi:hypothetical protein